MARGRKPLPPKPAPVIPMIHGDLPIPATIEKDKVARSKWYETVEIMRQLGTLSQSDSDAIEVYSQIYSRWRAAEDKVTELGVMIKSPNGYEISSPWNNIASSARKELLAYQKRLGLTPTDRKKVAANKKQVKESKWQGLISMDAS